mmetsp:Transcript_42051/g.98017  ORF Transcript_42051/g.98017 Transcript_42051/m.98017 type:complete len:144 (+) Transcript_42051:1029-1460(+)
MMDALAPKTSNSMAVAERVRKGESVSPVDALKYAQQHEYRAEDFSGCKCFHCGGVPLACACFFTCGNDCLCFPTFIFGLIPIPCMCSSERDVGSSWITRGKMQTKSGYIALVDQEKKTLAMLGQCPESREPECMCGYCYKGCC